jgi:hypothetical protein
MREHERHLWVAERESSEWVHRRHPATGMDQDRDAGIACDVEDRRGSRVTKAKRLCARM